MTHAEFSKVPSGVYGSRVSTRSTAISRNRAHVILREVHAGDRSADVGIGDVIVAVAFRPIGVRVVVLNGDAAPNRSWDCQSVAVSVVLKSDGEGLFHAHPSGEGKSTEGTPVGRHVQGVTVDPGNRAG